jgi:putative endonuclease
VFYVYILKSRHRNFIYTGFTSNLKKRFQEHNNKQELSTKVFSPFELIHYEAYKNKKDAIRREKYLKTSKGKTTLGTMLKCYFEDNRA